MFEIKDEIVLRGLKENNLKNINLNILKEKITVFTGLSGSGKSSVVFDTLATESRRQMTLNYPLYVRNQMPRYERRSEEHTSELQSRGHLVCRLLLGKKNTKRNTTVT